MAEQLDFADVITLLNHSRFLSIDPNPARREEGWTLYRGEHRVHTAKYPFHVLYLPSKVTADEILQATKAVAGRQAVHVVYPTSVADRLKRHKSAFPAGAVVEYWTTRDYLASYIREELGSYSARLPEAPKDYVDPPFDTPSGLKRKLPPPPLDFVATSPTPGEIERGTLGVILADAGHGKTYHCSYLVDRLRRAAQGVIPIFIDSRQWHTIVLDDLRSLSKTIVHSFRYYGAPIPWVEGCEDDFLRVSLKVGLFRIIFDGFDEYVLRNAGLVDPIDVLGALSDLAQETETRILLTSRSSFWRANIAQDQLAALLQRTGTYVFTLLPFDSNHARNYFQRRLEDLKRVERATQIFGTLRNQNPELIGRGFVLRLIADLVGRGGSVEKFPTRTPSQLLWLLERLCEREVERQELPLSAPEQLQVLTQFARERASGETGSTLLLEVCIQEAHPSIDDPARRSTVEKLKSHPLMAYDPQGDQWTFSEEQIGTVLLAEAITSADEGRLASLARGLAVSAGELEDLATAVCDRIVRASGPDERIERFKHVIRGLSATRYSIDATEESTTALTLRGAIAIRAVDLSSEDHATSAQRTAVLKKIVSGSRIEGFKFTGSLTRLDFRGMEFSGCAFQGTTWVACIFDHTTTFLGCAFSGAITAPKSEGVAEIALNDDCRFDDESRRWLENSRLAAGKRRYTREDLRADIEAVIRKFVSKGGLGLKTVRGSFLGKGTIAESPHRDAIIDVLLRTVLATHHLSGVSEGGVAVREEAIDSVKFFAMNNVFTGPLADAFERLARDLKVS